MATNNTDFDSKWAGANMNHADVGLHVCVAKKQQEAAEQHWVSKLDPPLPILLHVSPVPAPPSTHTSYAR
jgi:hypothetical protein